ncbi:S-adenosyl-L-methionine-dependent methyltransferase [Aspergillus alliaceus]|uniref:S-adenosyl-L-methionine-dependent methyltransferase n=1 Tax=Petromyces alliaceus TaxID=209559 RepID=A0A5N6FZ61_PETAA|nr:S-adenosyl-L-methionine-dependent methyltransferase [Aspergillus alliaceus]KAB8235331.1 S-adenosyl-L-methionine-dependent methyltransferase [Aspergillus alliaceus]KAE8387567.1 S-adenosyl-L-methionine-dependent methyltransferase [Aspergillus alliaceus]
MTSPDSQTEALDDEYLDTVTIQGREFQKFSIDHQIFFEPVDEEEAERLELQHQVFSKVFDNRLIFPPIPRPRKVLDCGYGTASWAIEAAERHPECEVIGLDIFPYMNPDEIPENLWLQVDDLNRPFTFPPNHFDLVHSRLLATGINRDRWPSYIRDIKRVLKPGGWVQLVEIYFNVQSDNGSITEQHALRRWSTQLMGSLEGVKDLRVGTRLRNLLTAAGLTEVDARMIPLPLSAWSTDPRMRDIGAMNIENVKKLLPALGLYPFTQHLRMPPQQFAELIAQAQEEADTPSLKAYFPL